MPSLQEVPINPPSGLDNYEMCCQLHYIPCFENLGGKCLKNAVTKVSILTTNKMEHTGTMIYRTSRSTEAEVGVSKEKKKTCYNISWFFISPENKAAPGGIVLHRLTSTWHNNWN